MYKVWAEKNQLVSVTLSRNKLKFCEKDKIYYTVVSIKLSGLPHNYTLEYLDIIKVNSKVKNTIRIEVAKKYWFSDINANIKKVKWMANKVALEDTRKANLDLKRIYNVSALWKFNNPRHILGTYKVLDDIKIHFFELDGLIFDFTLQ